MGEGPTVFFVAPPRYSCPVGSSQSGFQAMGSLGLVSLRDGTIHVLRLHLRISQVPCRSFPSWCEDVARMPQNFGPQSKLRTCGRIEEPTRRSSEIFNGSPKPGTRNPQTLCQMLQRCPQWRCHPRWRGYGCNGVPSACPTSRHGFILFLLLQRSVIQCITNYCKQKYFQRKSNVEQ